MPDNDNKSAKNTDREEQNIPFFERMAGIVTFGIFSKYSFSELAAPPKINHKLTISHIKTHNHTIASNALKAVEEDMIDAITLKSLREQIFSDGKTVLKPEVSELRNMDKVKSRSIGEEIKENMLKVLTFGIFSDQEKTDSVNAPTQQKPVSKPISTR